MSRRVRKEPGARGGAAAVVVAVVVAVATLGACGRLPPPRRPGDEYVKKIAIEGNREIPDRRLVAGLALERARRRGLPPDPYLIRLDADRIRGAYLRRGFLDVEVRSRVERDGGAATIAYVVEEGARARTEVAIAGIPGGAAVSPAAVRRALPIADGDPFDYAVYEEARPRLLGVVQDAGYAHARLDATIEADRARRVVTVRLAYELGPPCTFGPVELTGATGDLAGAVRARAQFRPGDPYSNHAIAATQRELYGMARFSTVQVQPAETTSPVVGVTIAVSEAARREVRLGGGFGADPTA